MEDRGEEEKKSRYNDALGFLNSKFKTEKREQKTPEQDIPVQLNPPSNKEHDFNASTSKKEGVYFFNKSEEKKSKSSAKKPTKEKKKGKMKNPSKSEDVKWVGKKGVVTAKSSEKKEKKHFHIRIKKINFSKKPVTDIGTVSSKPDKKTEKKSLHLNNILKTEEKQEPLKTQQDSSTILKDIDNEIEKKGAEKKSVSKPELTLSQKTKEKKKEKKLLFKSKTDKDEKKKEPKTILKDKKLKKEKTKKKESEPVSQEDESEIFEKLKHASLLFKQDTIEKLGFSEIDEWTEQDFYELVEPFANVLIMQNEENREKRYILLELPLNAEEQEKHDFIINAMKTFSLDVENVDKEGIETIFEHEVNEIINDYTLNIDPAAKEKLMYWLKKELLGLGKLEPLMKDVEIEDISCDGSGTPLFLYHRRQGSIQSNVMFEDEEELSGFVMKLAQKCGKHISIANPMLDATMPDGSRIQMTLSTEVSTRGSTFTIRKFKEQPFSPADIVEFNTMSSEMMAYLWLAVQHGANALISGGTASGKTSTLNAIALFIPRESKIVSIEETREINLPHPNWIPGVTRSGFGDLIEGKLTGEIDLYDLMKAALRQRPEFLIVGEIRGKEAYVLFQAMATGHTTYSTVHADSTKSLIHRLEGEPINIPRIMLQSLDIVCIQTIARVKNKRARRCKQIIEIIDIDPSTKELLTNEVFHWDPVTDTYMYSGKSYLLDQIRGKTNLSHEAIINELKQRTLILEWMVKNHIHSFDEVGTLTANYYENPDDILCQVKE